MLPSFKYEYLRKKNIIINVYTWDAPAQPPATISDQSGIVPSDNVNLSRIKSLTVNLIAFSGATPTNWGIKPKIIYYYLIYVFFCE